MFVCYLREKGIIVDFSEAWISKINQIVFSIFPQQDYSFQVYIYPFKYVWQIMAVL